MAVKLIRCSCFSRARSFAVPPSGSVRNQSGCILRLRSSTRKRNRRPRRQPPRLVSPFLRVLLTNPPHAHTPTPPFSQRTLPHLSHDRSRRLSPSLHRAPPSLRALTRPLPSLLGRRQCPPGRPLHPLRPSRRIRKTRAVVILHRRFAGSRCPTIRLSRSRPGVCAPPFERVGA